MKLHYGIYLGQVIDNEDPENLNRLLIKVPELDPFGKAVFRAMPKGLIAGKNYGFNYIPSKGDYIYVSFRLGLLKYPLWEPGYWAINEKPEEFTQDTIGFKFRDGAIAIYNEKKSQFNFILNDFVSITYDGGYLEANIGDNTLIISDSIKLKYKGKVIELSNNGATYKNLNTDHLTKAEALIDILVNNNTALITFITLFINTILEAGLTAELKATLTAELSILETLLTTKPLYTPIKTT